MRFALPNLTTRGKPTKYITVGLQMNGAHTRDAWYVLNRRYREMRLSHDKLEFQKMSNFNMV